MDEGKREAQHKQPWTAITSREPHGGSLEIFSAGNLQCRIVRKFRTRCSSTNKTYKCRCTYCSSAEFIELPSSYGNILARSSIQTRDKERSTSRIATVERIVSPKQKHDATKIFGHRAQKDLRNTPVSMRQRQN